MANRRGAPPDGRGKPGPYGLGRNELRMMPLRTHHASGGGRMRRAGDMRERRCSCYQDQRPPDTEAEHGRAGACLSPLTCRNPESLRAKQQAQFIAPETVETRFIASISRKPHSFILPLNSPVPPGKKMSRTRIRI